MKIENPPIAVIAVHGVGSQAPNRMAREVADSVLVVDREFSRFQETEVHIPVQVLKPRNPPPRHPSERFTNELLARYNPGPSTTDAYYKTVRLEGARPDGSPVHIYEMYWADLSHIGGGLLKFASELFLLIFHVGEIGSQVARFSAEKATHGEGCWRKALWSSALWVQYLGVWLLTAPIAILNLYELALASLILPASIDQSHSRYAASAGLAIILFMGVGWLLFRSYRPLTWWVVSAVALLGVTTYIIVLFSDHDPIGPYRVMAIAWSLAVTYMLFAVIRAYTALGNHAPRWQSTTRAVALGFGVYGLARLLLGLASAGESREAIYSAGVFAVRPLFKWVQLFWVALLVLLILQTLLTIVLRLRQPSREKRAAATLLISLVHSSAIFRILTLALWGTVWRSLQDRVIVTSSSVAAPGSVRLTGQQLKDQIQELLNLAETPLFTLATAIVAVALVMCVWALFPAALAEVLKPAHPNNEAYARRLGNWLDKGYITLLFAAAMTWLAMPCVIVAGYAMALFGSSETTLLPDILPILAWFMSGLIIGLLALRGPLEGLALGFHSAVAVAVDVDNYFREYPSDRIPRARILSRYASLLQYISHWKDLNGVGYKAIIIIAHSQGTVITADLLRYLKAVRSSGTPGDRPILFASTKIHFFTLGSPLRQLYGWRLPHLYEWAYHGRELARRPGAAVLSRRPSCCALGVEKWWNAYRSGDYVGRYLWRGDEDTARYCPGAEVGDATRREVCIGGGAHTHYFDEISEVASMIVTLIKST